MVSIEMAPVYGRRGRAIGSADACNRKYSLEALEEFASVRRDAGEGNRSMTSDEEPGDYASSPCYQHEFGDSVPTLAADVANRLNELLEGERAGAMGIRDMNTAVGEELRSVLEAVARDEARFCSMLRRQLLRHGCEPSRGVGVFYEKLAGRPTLDDKLRLLDRGQTAVVRTLDELLPSISDVALRADLQEMRDTHVRNIQACAKYLSG